MLPFLGYANPAIPADARIHYVRGAVDCPKAGTVTAGQPFPAVMDGIDPFGGTGYLFRKNALDGPEWEAEIVAVGWGVQGWRRPLVDGGSIAGAGTHVPVSALAPDTANGYGAALDADQTAGNRAVHCRELVVSASAAGLVLQHTTSGFAMHIGAGSPARLRDVLLDTRWQLMNTTGAPISYGVTVVEDDPRARDYLGVDVVTRNVDGSAVVGADLIRIAKGYADTIPVQLLEHGQRPELRPVSPGARLLRLDEGQAFSVAAGQFTDGIIPTSARVVAEMAVAVWRNAG